LAWGAGEEEAPGSLERSWRGRGPSTQGSSDGVSEDGGVKLKRESRPGLVSQKQLGIRGRGPSRHPQARDWCEILDDKAGEPPPQSVGKSEMMEVTNRADARMPVKHRISAPDT